MTTEEKEILEIVKQYVDRVNDHHIDETSVQSALADIVSMCEDLALEIEDGKHELIDDRVGYDD